MQIVLEYVNMLLLQAFLCRTATHVPGWYPDMEVLDLIGSLLAARAALAPGGKACLPSAEGLGVNHCWEMCET